MKKLDYDDSLMLENLVNNMNELIEENEYLHKRINMLWKYVRVGNKKKKEKEDKKL